MGGGGDGPRLTAAVAGLASLSVGTCEGERLRSETLAERLGGRDSEPPILNEIDFLLESPREARVVEAVLGRLGSGSLPSSEGNDMTKEMRPGGFGSEGVEEGLWWWYFLSEIMLFDDVAWLQRIQDDNRRITKLKLKSCSATVKLQTFCQWYDAQDADHGLAVQSIGAYQDGAPRAGYAWMVSSNEETG